VTLDGAYITSFKGVTGFTAYTTRGSKGGINYHIAMQGSGESVEIGGGNAHEDVQQVAGYLNAYLAEVRGKR